MSWYRRLSTTIVLKDGRVLRTLGDAAELLVSLSEAIQAHAWIEHAAELLMMAAEFDDQEEIKAATIQVERALRRERML
jgi:hypothetical protein